MPVGQRLWKNKMWAGLSDGQGAEPGSRQGDEGLGPQAWQVWVEADSLMTAQGQGGGQAGWLLGAARSWKVGVGSRRPPVLV